METKKIHCLQTLQVASAEDGGSNSGAFHLALDPACDCLLLANVKTTTAVVVHLKHEGLPPNRMRFDFLREFALAYPIISVTIMNTMLADNVEEMQLVAASAHRVAMARAILR